MAETFSKVNDFTVEITTTPEVVPVVDRRSLKAARRDLRQARDSRELIRAKHAAELAPINETIALFQARVDAILALQVVENPDEVVE